MRQNKQMVCIVILASCKYHFIRLHETPVNPSNYILSFQDFADQCGITETRDEEIDPEQLVYGVGGDEQEVGQ